MLKINDESLSLLRNCLMNNNQSLIWVLDVPDNITDHIVLNQIREAIGDELIKYGLCNSEPTDYGLKLEKLIDTIGRIFM